MTSAHKIFLSRHGQTEYMLDKRIGGDSCLTGKGQAYAQQLPQLILPHLTQSPQAGSNMVVLTSTLQRTIQTAAHLPFKQQRIKALDEINAGICEHMTYEQVAQVYPHVSKARAQDKLGYRYPSGESYLDLVCRLWPVVTALEQRQGPVVVVAHQAVMRVLVGLLLRRPLQDLPTMAIPLHTVMQLTPTSAGSYDMTCFKATLTASDAAAEPAAGASTALPTPAQSCRTLAAPSLAVIPVSSCRMRADDTLTTETLPRQRWTSCMAQLTGLQGPQSPCAVTAGGSAAAACSM